MIRYWKPGDQVVQRGVVNQQVWIAKPVTVVHDSPEMTVLFLVPGTRCKFSTDLIKRKYSGKNTPSPLSRWDEHLSGNWEMQDWIWQKSRFLIVKEPGKYFSTYLIWNDASDEFHGWYVNFELPFTRSSIGVDTLDAVYS